MHTKVTFVLFIFDRLFSEWKMFTLALAAIEHATVFVGANLVRKTARLDLNFYTSVLYLVKPKTKWLEYFLDPGLFFKNRVRYIRSNFKLKSKDEDPTFFTTDPDPAHLEKYSGSNLKSK